MRAVAQHFLGKLPGGQFSERRRGFSSSLIKAALRNLFCNTNLVGCNSYMADFSLGLGFLQNFVKTASVPRSVALLYTMQLVNINIICFQVMKGSFQLGTKLFWSFCTGFCCNEYFFAFYPTITKGLPKFFFAVGVGAGCIKKSHAALIGFSENRNCSVHIYALNWQGPKGIMRSCDSSGS